MLIAGCKSSKIPNTVTGIGNNAFNDCSSLASITIPESVTSIGNAALYDCRDLTSITIPNSVTSVKSSCFYGCASLVSIEVAADNAVFDSRENCNVIIRTSDNALIFGCKATNIPKTVTIIGYEAFGGCSGMTSIIIPESVDLIRALAFYGCSSLTTIILQTEEPPGLNEDALEGIPHNATIYVPESCSGCYTSADPWYLYTIKKLINDVITISDMGMATYCNNHDLDFTENEQIKAYVASGFDPYGHAVLLTRAYKIPAGTGFLVKGDEGSYKMPIANVKYIYANLFLGTTEQIELPGTADGYANYILAKGADDVVKFYQSEGGTLAANKAYLKIPTSAMAASRSLRLTFTDDDETTGIDTAMGSEADEDVPVYNLNGQCVVNLQSGVYVKNGKVFIVK